MSLDALLGSTLVVGFQGRDATPQLIKDLRATHAQSLILFERNITSPEQLAALLADLQESLGPRLVMIDQEGGRVVRIRSGVTQFPDAQTVGRTQDAAAVERQGRVEAEELRHLGIHVNLAPCVDVLVEGGDPVIGDRSYGPDPEQVSSLGAARIRGLQSHGAVACAKHFPGLGAVPRDPHKTLPTIGLGWEALRAVHLPPFEAAIRAGVAAVMSSHVCYPGLGEPEGVPATFSRRLIQGLLREELGFSGLILTDDLEMGALRTFGSLGEAAIRAREAGHDLALICSDLSGAREALSALRQACRAGRLKEADVEASAARVARVRERIFSARP